MSQPYLSFSDFSFDLDDSLLATAHRSVEDVKLVIVDAAANQITFGRFTDIEHYLPPSSCTIWNDTAAGPSQLSGRHASGIPIQICFLIERSEDARQWEALILSPDGEPPFSGRFSLSDGLITGSIDKWISDFDASFWNEKDRYRGFRGLISIDRSEAALRTVLKQEGRLIHPWYTDLNTLDTQLLNPITALRSGSVCPSLPARRFTSEMLSRLDSRGISRVPISLEMNFSWNTYEDATPLADYAMNEERYTISPSAADELRNAAAHGRELIAIGTSGVRVIESHWPVRPGSGLTSLFVYPGFPFRAITGLLTNLHIPQSTHVILAAAVGGREIVLRALVEATTRGLMFGIHGDSLLILSGGRWLNAVRHAGRGVQG